MLCVFLSSVNTHVVYHIIDLDLTCRNNTGGTMSRQAAREADVASQQQVLHEQSVSRASELVLI